MRIQNGWSTVETYQSLTDGTVMIEGLNQTQKQHSAPRWENKSDITPSLAKYTTPELTVSLCLVTSDNSPRR